jgi:hypothetical protein
VLRHGLDPREEIACAGKLTGIDIGVGKQDGETHRLDLVAASVGCRQRSLEDGNRRVEVADERVRAAERIG